MIKQLQHSENMNKLKEFSPGSFFVHGYISASKFALEVNIHQPALKMHKHGNQSCDSAISPFGIPCRSDIGADIWKRCVRGQTPILSLGKCRSTLQDILQKKPKGFCIYEVRNLYSV